MKRLLIVVPALLSGCGAPGPMPAETVTGTAPGTTVDSILPPAVALERFRAGGSPVRALEGGEASIGALVAAWVAAIETEDTTAIRRLLVDRAEFAWLYYPESQFARRPLYQPPEILWMRIQVESEKGIVRVLRRLGGSTLGYRAVRCPGPPRVEGANRLHEYCAVERVIGGDTVPEVLFGGILERGGRFKFLGYGTRF